MIDLTTLSVAQGFIIQGDAVFDRAGYSVSSAGDVNGDGFDDLIVGAPWGGESLGEAGEAYVVFGSGSGFGTDVGGRQVIDLTTLSAGEGFIIQGDALSDRAGWSVSSAGDVNGDGFDDLIVGAMAGDDGGPTAGEAYVVFGSGSEFGTAVGGRQVIDLTTLSAGEGFIIQGDATGDQTGWSVSSAGDVNGDGFDDLIVGASHGDDGGDGAGEAYVVFGSGSGFGTAVGGRQVIDLTTLSAGAGFIIQGDTTYDGAGWSASSAGDVNGDGFDDLIVGAPSGDDGGYNAGEAYVVFGSGSGFGTDVGGRRVIDLTTLSAGAGFIIQGDAAGDQAGWSVSSAGDVNGDGFDDLIVGAPSGDDGGDRAGEAYVVFGSGSGFGTAVGGRQVIDLTTLSTGAGFIIQGDAAGDWAGWSVSSAGDVNGDGFGDLIVGARAGNDGGADAGEAYVVFGSGSGFGTDVGGRRVIDLTTLSTGDGFIIQGDQYADLAGSSVSSAGDVNGDGFDDLIVGALSGNDGGYNAGEAYVVFGGAFGGSTTPVVTNGTGATEMLIGGAGDDQLSGGGGADVIRSGGGDDLIVVSDLAFLKIDGGTGVDTLSLAAPGLTLDLTDRQLAAKIDGIERVDMTNAGNTLVVDRLAVINETPASGNGLHILTVDGGPGDTVEFTETQWAFSGTVIDSAKTYDRYLFGNAEVRVQQGVETSIPIVLDTTQKDIGNSAPEVRAAAFLARAVYGETAVPSAFSGPTTGDNGIDDNYKGYLATQGWTVLDADELGFLETELSGFTEAGLYQGRLDFGDFDAQGLVATTILPDGSPDGSKALVLAFRGTDGDDPAVWEGQAWTGDGLYDHYQMFQPLILAALAYATDVSNGIDQVIVTGHSLGGAVADVFTGVDAHLFVDLNFDLTVVSLASPGVDPNVFRDGPADQGFFPDFDSSVVTIDGNGSISLNSPYYYIGIAHAQDRVHFSNEVIDPVPNQLNPKILLNSNVRFNDGSDTLRIYLPNISNTDVDYKYLIYPDQGFGAQHNGELYWANIEEITSSPLIAYFNDHRITIGIGDYSQTKDYNGGYSSGGFFSAFTGRGHNDEGALASLKGSGSNDFILGLSGNDEIYGFAGNDLLDGGEGNDFVMGGPGNDVIDGGGGTNTARYEFAIDEYVITHFDDHFQIRHEPGASGHPSEGTDTLYNIDKLEFGFVVVPVVNFLATKPVEVLVEKLEAVVTTVYGTRFVDTFSLTMDVAGGVVTVGAVAKDVVIEGLQGAAHYTLQAFEELFFYGSSKIDELILNELVGTTIAQNTVHFDAGGGNDVMNATAADRRVVADGGSGNDILRSGSGHDRLFGGSGNDLLFGGTGDDSLDGGTGVDRMNGGTGNDVYVVDNAGDKTIESSGQGTDLVKASITHVLAANVEKLVLTGSTAINGTGNSLANTLVGNTGKNTLNGGAGDDILSGGVGKDKLVGGVGRDIFVFADALLKGNADKLLDFQHRSDKILLDADIFTAFGSKVSKKQFVEGKKAGDKNDYLIRDEKKLFYDADGKGGAKQVLVAKVSKKTDLDHKDFMVADFAI